MSVNTYGCPRWNSLWSSTWVRVLKVVLKLHDCSLVLSVHIYPGWCCSCADCAHLVDWSEVLRLVWMALLKLINSTNTLTLIQTTWNIDRLLISSWPWRHLLTHALRYLLAHKSLSQGMWLPLSIVALRLVVVVCLVHGGGIKLIIARLLLLMKNWDILLLIFLLIVLNSCLVWARVTNLIINILLLSWIMTLLFEHV